MSFWSVSIPHDIPLIEGLITLQCLFIVGQQNFVVGTLDFVDNDSWLFGYLACIFDFGQYNMQFEYNFVKSGGFFNGKEPRKKSSL